MRHFSLPAVVCVVSSVAGLLWSTAALEAAPESPNIIVILADDLGYGDVSCLNPAGKIQTPHLDGLAASGVTFTDAHTPSSVCTPTRYGLLTGRYAWRTRLKSGVLLGYDRRLIEPDRQTIASYLQGCGYQTACLGKWHLGMDFPLKAGGFATSEKDMWNVDYDAPIQNGPRSVGFDYYFGISASLDMPPYVFIENEHAVTVPTVEKTWIRKGPASVDFEAVDVLPRVTQRACEYIAEHAGQPQPFFIYMPLNSPHTPIVPAPQWQGRSGLTSYADFVLQTDDAVGQVLTALEAAGCRENTLVIFTSDNGCSPRADFPALEQLGHDPSGPFRGHKADIYEGGHRVPFLVSWPAAVPAGRTCAELVCLTDIFRTIVEVSGGRLPDNAGEDSFSFRGALLDTPAPLPRDHLVMHSIFGAFGIREGRHKLCLCPGSGGWSVPRPKQDNTVELPDQQLFDLAATLDESSNLISAEPEVAKRLLTRLEQIASTGRSTPGVPQTVYLPADIRRGEDPQETDKPAANRAGGQRKSPPVN